MACLEITEIWKDFYGCIAYLKATKIGTYVLKMYTPTGNKFYEKEYNTRRGARIAMGKYSDCWKCVKSI